MIISKCINRYTIKQITCIGLTAWRTGVVTLLHRGAPTRMIFCYSFQLIKGSVVIFVMCSSTNTIVVALFLQVDMVQS
jgi:hypothetical protein